MMDVEGWNNEDRLVKDGLMMNKWMMVCCRMGW